MLARAVAGTGQGAATAAEADALTAHAAASTALKELDSRAGVFERRAMERDSERRIYGPKMSRRVLDFCDALQSAAGHCAEIGEALAPARRRHAEVDEAVLTAAADAAFTAVAVKREAREASIEARVREEQFFKAKEASQHDAPITLNGTPISAQEIQKEYQDSCSQWPELERLTRKMARVMPRTSSSW